jgi:hypothetical protein
MPKWIHFSFCGIWLLTGLVFARLAFDSYLSTKTELMRFSVEFPAWGTVKIMGVDLPETLTKMSETNNKNVAAQEESIRSSARLTLGLNILSSFMAFVGLAAQVGAYRYEQRDNDKEERHEQSGAKPSGVGENANLRQSAGQKEERSASQKPAE